MIKNIGYIDRKVALLFVKNYHYSKVFPRITHHFIGGFANTLEAVLTLGWGVRPLHTIKIIFPTLSQNDYWEIGKLCVSDAMPRNTESNFIAQVISLIKKNHPEKKILFSWSDGVIGKPGYVYQSSNFFYGGYIWTEMYINEKTRLRVHPRSMQGLSTGERKDGNKFKSRAYEITTDMGFQKYKGLQFRYAYPLCNKREWKAILDASPFKWVRGNYPKDADCKWQKQVAKNQWIECAKPEVKITDYKGVADSNTSLSVFFEE